MPFYPDHARIDQNWPERAAQCQRCGDVYSLSDLSYQYQWAGLQLINTNFLVCPTCLDVPAPFQRTIILPPDPPPTYLARQISFPFEEDDYRVTENGVIRVSETGNITRIPENGNTSIDPDPIP